MSLYVYRKKTASLALAAGNPIVTPAVAPADGARGKPFDVTSELRPNLTVDPQKGVAGGLSAADFAALQAQVASKDFEYEWTTGIPEYNVGVLVIGQAAADVAESPLDIYVNGGTGNDANAGTLAAPVATLAAAHALVAGYKRRLRFIMDADGTGRSYAYPGPAGLGFNQPVGNAVGPNATPPQYLGFRRTLVAQQAETVGGSLNTATIAVPATTITDNPLTSGAATINVTSTTGFPTSGWLKTESELIRYTGVTATSFTGCVRGQAGTAAAAHVVTTSIFAFLAGHFLQQTAADTTVTDNPLTSGATTINVASTAGYPTASKLRIDDELVTYTGKTATSFTGVTRGVSNTTAAAHALGATVRLIGSRKQIKTNTATTVVVSRNFAANNAIGDMYTINTPGTTVTASTNPGANGPLVGAMVLKDLILSGNFAPTAGVVVYRGCNSILTGTQQFNVGAQDGGAVLPGAGLGAWLPDGAENPCDSQEDDAGIRIEGQNASQFVNTVNVRNVSTVVGVINALHCLVTDDSQSLSFNTLYTLHGGALVAKEGGYLRNNNVNAANRALLQGAQLVVQRGSIALMNRYDINDVIATGAFVATGDAIVVEQGGFLDMSEMGGTGNAGVGLNCRDGIVRCLDALSTVTGVGGDIKCGSRPARTWADFNNASPPSGLPSRVEMDVPGFVARPYKIAFAGLGAADLFDITTLAAFATPAVTPPAIQNASTLRVVAGAAGHLGTYVLTDTGGTPISTAAGTVVGVATLSDDGKTITFPAGAAVTAFTIEYLPIAGLAQATASMGGRIYQQNINA